MLTDTSICRRMPHPIAAAWRQVTLASNAHDTIFSSAAAAEVLMRTLTALLLADYLRGPRDADVEATMAKLSKPTMGNWKHALCQLCGAIASRATPASFMPQSSTWLLAPESRAQATLNSVLRQRNRLFHGGRVARGQASEEAAGELRVAVRELLSSLDWLASYRIVRFAQGRPAADKSIHGRLQTFAGSEEMTSPRAARWRGWLLDDRVYLLNPEADGALDLSPFLVPLHNRKLQRDALYLLDALHRMKTARLSHVGTGDRRSLPLDDGKRVAPGEGPLGPDQDDRHVDVEGLSKRFSTTEEIARLNASTGVRYEIKDELGRGGMGVVYRARDVRLGREVALKVLSVDLESEERYRRRFVREGQTLGKLAHPHLVSVHDCGELPGDGRPFLCMSLATGGTVRDRLRADSVTPAEVERWSEQVLMALVCLHNAGVVHRDIKPGNLLLDGDGNCLVGDLGIALLEDGEHLTTTFEQVGSLAYLAPEARGSGRVDGKADVYGLAVVLDELLTGERHPEKAGKGIESGLGALIREMGAQDPDERPTAEEALSRLRSLGAMPTGHRTVRPTGTGEKEPAQGPPQVGGGRQPPVARMWWRWLMVAAALLVAVGAVGGWLALRDPPDVSYVARLSAKDHHNRKGKPLETAAEIVAQDRANVHDLGVRDPEDDTEELYFDAYKRRKWMRRILRDMPGETAARIRNGTPLVRVSAWSDRVEVEVLDAGDDKPMSSSNRPPSECPRLEKLAGNWRFNTVVLGAIERRKRTIGVNGHYTMDVRIDRCRLRATITKTGYTRKRLDEREQVATSRLVLESGVGPGVHARGRFRLANAKGEKQDTEFGFFFVDEQLYGYWWYAGDTWKGVEYKGALRGAHGVAPAVMPRSDAGQPCVAQCQWRCGPPHGKETGAGDADREAARDRCLEKCRRSEWERVHDCG